jgi:protein-tyrosine phosphatase
LRAELCPEDLDVLLPIPDFKVPTRAQLEDVEYVIRRTLTAAIEGKRVWAGCMGGWGRTGMFLALLAKVADYDDAVGYVRRVYSKKACETKEQTRYVAEFDVRRLRRRLYGSAWRERIRRIVFWWR